MGFGIGVVELGGRQPRMIFEEFQEIFVVGKAGHFSELGQGIVGVEQLTFYIFDTHLIDKLLECLAELTPKQPT
jgi:hypothetical protein